MNEHTDRDPFLELWFGEGPTVMPDRVAIVVAARIARQGQRRAWRLDGRPAMNLFFKLATVAALGAVLLGGAVLLAGRQTAPPEPAPAPSISASPEIPVVPLQQGMIGIWVADIGDIAGLGNTDPRIRLITSNDGAAIWLLTNSFGNTAMRSASIAARTGESRLVSEVASVGCKVGDEGSYRATVSPDGTRLTFEVVGEACATRAEALVRTWTRTVDITSTGGLGAIAAFDPVFTIHLPDAAFGGVPEPEAVVEVTSLKLDRTLRAMKDPWGLSKACIDDGSKVAVDPTADAFVAYLRTLPGITVETSELQVDGHRVVRAAIASDAGIDCPTMEINLWTPKVFTSETRVSMGPGDHDVAYLAEVGGDLILLQWVGPGVTQQEEQDVLSTIRFLDGLPTTP